jgi:Spy/CpxP family protein refolding chaperone
VRATFEEAHAAIQAGKSREEVAQIIAKAAPAIIRLETARQALRQQILAVLTPEQKASGCLPLG